MRREVHVRFCERLAVTFRGFEVKKEIAVDTVFQPDLILRSNEFPPEALSC